MEVELEMGFQLANLKVTLSEFTAVVTHISGEAKRQEVKQTLKEMIVEVRRSYDTVVDVFTPLYGLDTPRKFKSQFAVLRTGFKGRYLKDMGSVRTHCSIVSAKLDDLKKQKAWMKNLPYVRRSFNRLQELGADWVANDARLADGMEQFLKSTNRLLDKVNRMLVKDSSEAYRFLQMSIHQYEDELLAIKRNLDQLNIVSANI